MKKSNDYQKGLRAGKIDYNRYGVDHMIRAYKYGLSGRSSTFCRGYMDYLRLYVKKVKK